jgi:long-chain fatty acid transport protein
MNQTFDFIVLEIGMRTKRLITLSFGSLSTLLFIFPTPLFAIGASGLSSQFVGIKALGLANAFVAEVDDPSANYFNPAGLTQLEGWQTTLGATGLILETDFEDQGVSASMEKNLSLLPHFFVTRRLREGKWAFGFGVTSPFGLTTEWSKTGFARYVTTKSTLETLHYNPSVAYPLNEVVSVGVGVDYLTVNKVTQESQIDQSSVGGSDGSQKLKGDGGQWGYNAGILWKPTAKHSFGAAYRSQINVHINGDIRLAGLDPTLQSTYNFPGANYSADVETDLKFPQSVIIGYYYVPSERWTLLIDYEWTDWSVNKRTQLDIKETDPNRSAFLNSTNPLLREWRDVHAYAIGSQYNFRNGIMLRLGYGYMNSAVPSNTWDPSIPDANQHNIANGLGYSWGDLTLDVAYNVIIFEKRKINNDVGAAVPTSIDGKYNTLVQVIGVGFTYKFLGNKIN